MSHQEPEIDFTQAGYVQKIYAYLKQGKEQALSSLQQRYPDYALLALGVYSYIFGFEQLKDKPKTVSALIELIENCYLTYKTEPLSPDYIYSAVNQLLGLYKTEPAELEFLLRQRLETHFAAHTVEPSEFLAAKMISLTYAFSCFFRGAEYISAQSLELFERIYLKTDNDSLYASLRHFFIEDVLSLSLQLNLVPKYYLQPIVFNDLQREKACEFLSLDSRDARSEIPFFREQYTISGVQKYQLLDENGFLSYERIVQAWDQIARRKQETA